MVEVAAEEEFLSVREGAIEKRRAMIFRDQEMDCTLTDVRRSGLRGHFTSTAPMIPR
jgi:hypothetical protein